MKRCAAVYFCLFSSCLLAAQDPFADSLAQQFSNYQLNALQEKLFVHTDKTFYLAGETVWFKVYSVDESFLKPLPISRIAYIEIVNREQKPVLQIKISLNKGTGHGSLTLPVSLTSGNYIFRAYTGWMKNFPADLFYEQTISIVNTIRGKAPDEVSVKPDASIQFFPEGGDLVYGLTSKIGFKATGRSGKGLSCTGIVINQKKDTIAHFRSFHNGMGNFQLTPVKNEIYYAQVKINDSLYTQRLPAAANQGFVMHLTGPESGKLTISVHATAEFYNTNVYLFVHTRHLIKVVQSARLQSGEAEFNVDKKDLGAGISTFTLFNQSRQPVCERLFFKRPDEQLIIGAKTDQSVYAPRHPVTIDLTTSGLSHLPGQANMSLSVFLLDSLQSLPEENIVSYFLLTSDLKAVVESPSYYLEHTDAESDQAIDDLLLTQGWRRFKWKDVFQFRKPAFEFLPEIEGPVINGTIVNKTARLPAQNTLIYLTIPGSPFAFSSATSNEAGLIRFTFSPRYKNSVVIMQPANRNDSAIRLDIANTYSDQFSNSSINALSLSREYKSVLLNRSIGNQVENTYLTRKKYQYTPDEDHDSTPFYGMPDRLYNLEDYTRFVTMEEVLREFVDDVRVRKEGEKFRFRVRNRLFNTFFDDDPLILLDGVPVYDATKIIALDPLKIKKIEVVTHRFYSGSSIVDGIVSLTSYNGNLGPSQLDPNAIVVEYQGLQQQREFYSPVYPTEEQQQNPIPDFRNVLLWNPKIITGPDGKTQIKFYTSDLTGKFAVFIQGITTDGLPGYSTQTFSVAR